MTEILPLSPGLLISMAVRMDHSFGMDIQPFFGVLEEKSLVERQKETLDIVYEEYKTAFQQVPIQAQRLEECTGNGFYALDREASYRAWATPEALAHAEELVVRFNTDMNPTLGL